MRGLRAALSAAKKKSWDRVRGVMASQSSFAKCVAARLGCVCVLTRNSYRACIRTAHPPCIPYLGVSMQDMVFIEDGNPDFLKVRRSGGGCTLLADCVCVRRIKTTWSTSTNAVCWPTSSRFVGGGPGDTALVIADVVHRHTQDIQQHVQAPFNIEPVEEIIEFIALAQADAENVLYEKSLAVRGCVDGGDGGGADGGGADPAQASRMKGAKSGCQGSVHRQAAANEAKLRFTHLLSRRSSAPPAARVGEWSATHKQRARTRAQHAHGRRGRRQPQPAVHAEHRAVLRRGTSHSATHAPQTGSVP